MQNRTESMQSRTDGMQNRTESMQNRTDGTQAPRRNRKTKQAIARALKATQAASAKARATWKS